nr:PREDICTED: putative UDP-GlcNAc:betaGal beta-1,3-N-acetylglucosaminyltransferase LOC100288842 [Anolis carolinensis]|eukprot:XP_008121939.1 PREDICTED: putative UDP-GlcNAc:betaGal beta-1,3-N-acetylglucosaminyltransferase LOC100288842 [Anolis carolinensis]
MKDNISKAFVIVNSESCSDKEIFLLALVFSGAGNASRRQVVRETWANATHIHNYSILVLFLLGKPSEESTQLEILKEMETHPDLIQGVFPDAPENQTLKTFIAVEWIVTFCSQARFVLKIDEEVFVNVPALVEYLLNLRARNEDVYLGRVVLRESPDRDAQSRGFIPPQTYPEKYYPDYCGAEAFVVSQDVARKVFVASRGVPLSVPPGVFMGMCAKKVGVVPVHSSRFSGKRHIRFNRCCYKFLFTSFVESESLLLQEWEEISHGQDCTLLETYYGLVSCRVMTYLDGFKRLSVDALPGLGFSD